jgi:histidinol-phosphatase (PHP family)
MWTNYHTHTSFCDGKKSVDEVVKSAISQDLVAIGLSSHAPVPFERKWCMKQEALPSYLEEIRRAKLENNIQVYAGLEVDFIPEKISPADFRSHLDYVIGSVHFVDEFADGEGWEIDGPYEQFLKGYDAIFKSDMRAVTSRYFDLTRQMVRDSSPEIVGHLDKIKMQNKDQSTFREDEPWYVDEIQSTLNVIRDNGCIVEVNTRGLYQGKTSTPYPSPWIIARIANLGIPVTLSSDAHHPDDLVNRFSDTASILLHAGIKKIRILTDGKWRDVPFDEHGIKDH